MCRGPGRDARSVDRPRRLSVTSPSTRSAGSTGTWPPRLTDLQRGSVGEAAPASRTSRRTATSRTCYAASALTLARAADGDVDGARALALKVAGLESSTYSDRIMAMLGGGLGQARIGEHEVADAWLRTARELADGTEDHLLAAVVRVAEARAAAALGRPEADDDLHRAHVALAAMGVSQPGWDTAFRLAAGLPYRPAPMSGGNGRQSARFSRSSAARTTWWAAERCGCTAWALSSRRRSLSPRRSTPSRR